MACAPSLCPRWRRPAPASRGGRFSPPPRGSGGGVRPRCPVIHYATVARSAASEGTRAGIVRIPRFSTQSSIGRGWRLVLLGALCTWLFPTVVGAHASLLQTDPQPNSTLDHRPDV